MRFVFSLPSSSMNEVLLCDAMQLSRTLIFAASVHVKNRFG
ncbi:hypothetical protein MtrunA17_Chr3g0081921 [Medicago truncatula]|uniref:Uncharacterized protein n=1 Tax=Medicago truncatula TaxID=3880 RepID=A0A396IJ17_MEDTR|nr:hypothetical protein MtrunA17_Chr3g0081921 [Medicago truncatula]